MPGTGTGPRPRSHPPAGQLSLPLDRGGRLPARIRPMRPTPGDGPFDDPAYLFEPWWPGSRTFVVIEAGRVRLEADELADPVAAFPELGAIANLIVPPIDGTVLGGTVLVLDRGGRPSQSLLRRRLSDPSQHSGRPAFVADDLLYAGGRSLLRRPLSERRTRLDELLRPTDWCLASRGYIGDGTTVAQALIGLGIGGLSARRLSAIYRPGPAGDAWFWIPLPTADRPSSPLLTVIRSLGL